MKCKRYQRYMQVIQRNQLRMTAEERKRLYKDWAAFLVERRIEWPKAPNIQKMDITPSGS